MDVKTRGFKIKPHEILRKLGFEGINEEGLDINPNDGFLYDSALNLIGKAISIDLNKLSSTDFDIFKGLSVFAKSDDDASRFLKNHDPEKAKILVQVILDKMRSANKPLK